MEDKQGTLRSLVTMVRFLGWRFGVFYVFFVFLYRILRWSGILAVRLFRERTNTPRCYAVFEALADGIWLFKLPGSPCPSWVRPETKLVPSWQSKGPDPPKGQWLIVP